MPRKHEIKSDMNLNPILREEIQSLRGTIADQVKTIKGFNAQPHPERPSMIITNLKNGKMCTVPLFAYGAVMEALKRLV